MQDPSYTFCNQLRSFCDHLLSMCNNLKTSMNQRPIPLDSSLNPFVEGLNRRATSTNNQVEALESMTIDTISFRELLGHCNELYKQNENAVSVLQDRLKEYGYEAVEIDSSDEPLPFEGISPRADKFADLEALSNHSLAIQIPEQTIMLSASCLSLPAASARDCSNNVLQDDPMFEDSLSLQDLGLSDACLATLASEANAGNWNPKCDRPMQQSQERKHQEKELHSDHWDGPDVFLNAHCPTDSSQSISEDLGKTGTIREGPIADCLLEVSKEDYEKTPSWLRGLASWEELDDAIGKINSFLSNRAKQGDGKGGDLLDQDDLKPLGFGSKVKPFLLLLVRMNCLTIEHEAGATMYRVNLK